MGSIKLPTTFLPQDAYQQIDKIAGCTEPTEVAALTKSVITTLGAHSFVYSTLIADDRSDERESFRHFIGCDLLWCRMYNERKWYMNDPFVEYARTNSKEIFGSQIELRTQAQKEMLKMAEQHGFRSGMVIPTHSSTNASERLGMFYVGSNDEPAIGEPILKQHRVLFRALAMELLDWWVKRLQLEAATKYKLNAEEINLLQLKKNGISVAEIGARLDVKEKKIYQQFQVIQDKIGASNINEAVKLATFSCLIR